MTSLKILAAATLAALASTAASAETYFYTLTGGYSADWELPSAPTPDQSVPGEGFALESVPGNFPGTAAGAAYLDFFSAANGGGLSISDADGPTLLVALKGAPLYTGDELAPAMRRGIFAMTDSAGNGGYTLTITDQFGGVPEPSAWALMILGFGTVGGAMRARRTVVRFA